MTTNYQKHFNKVIGRMRIATSAALMDNEPLMRTLVKILYDFSDDLKNDGIINDDGENANGKKIHR